MSAALNISSGDVSYSVLYNPESGHDRETVTTCRWGRTLAPAAPRRLVGPRAKELPLGRRGRDGEGAGLGHLGPRPEQVLPPVRPVGYQEEERRQGELTSAPLSRRSHSRWQPGPPRSPVCDTAAPPENSSGTGALAITLLIGGGLFVSCSDTSVLRRSSRSTPSRRRQRPLRARRRGFTQLRMRRSRSRGATCRSRLASARASPRAQC